MKPRLSTSMPRARSAIKENLPGFALVEALLAGSILALVLFIFSSILIFGQESARIAGERQRAIALAEEGLEAARNLAEFSFAGVTTGPHGLVINSSKWQFSGSEDYTGGFTRRLDVADVNSFTKSVTSTVTWKATPQRTGTVAVNTRLTNWRRPGTSNWASMSVESGVVLPNTNPGVKVETRGNYAFVVTTTGTGNFSIINISNPASPVISASATLTGTFTDMAVSDNGNFVYLSSTNNNGEFVIINTTSKTSPGPAYVYGLTGTHNALSIAVVGTTVYIGRAKAGSSDPMLHIINAANPAAATTLGYVDGSWLSDSVNDIFVSPAQDFLYIASSENSYDFQIFDISTPSNPTYYSSINIVGSNTTLNGSAIIGWDTNGNGYEDKIALGRLSEGRVWLIDVSSIGSPSLILANGYSVPGLGAVNIDHLALFNSNQYLAVAAAAAAQEITIVNIANLSVPTNLGTLNIYSTNNFYTAATPLYGGVAYSTTTDRLLGAGRPFTTPNNRNFVIIKPN